MIADSHAHLDMPDFEADLEEVLSRAVAAGLHQIVTIGTARPADDCVERTLRIAEKYDLVFAAIGVHPHDACVADDNYLSWLETAADHPKVVLWGEIGLDYHYDNSPREDQRRALIRQLQIARRKNLPVSIHCRDAWPDLLAILGEEWSGDHPGGILHSFTGTRQHAQAFADLGFLISFSGIVTFKKADGIREAARSLRLDQVLVETDCPWLAPVPHRGKRNEPAFVVDVARGLAGAMGFQPPEIAAATSKNLRHLLRLRGNLPPDHGFSISYDRINSSED
jgi:TatD DNase family protein